MDIVNFLHYITFTCEKLISSSQPWLVQAPKGVPLLPPPIVEVGMDFQHELQIVEQVTPVVETS